MTELVKIPGLRPLRIEWAPAHWGPPGYVTAWVKYDERNPHDRVHIQVLYFDANRMLKDVQGDVWLETIEQFKAWTNMIWTIETEAREYEPSAVVARG